MFRGSVKLGMVLIVTALFLGVISGPAHAAGPAGKIVATVGPVEIVRKNGKTKALVGFEVQETDRIETGAGGVVQIRFSDGSSFTAYEKSSLRLEQFRKGSGSNSALDSVVDVAYGKLRFFVNPDGKTKKNAKFKTKNAVMGIRGTSGVIDSPQQGETLLVVLTGKVEVFNPKFPSLPVLVNANSLTRVRPNEVPNPPVTAPKELISNLVPKISEAAGFSDDSASASASSSPSGAEKNGSGAQEKEEKKNDQSSEEKKPVDEKKSDDGRKSDEVKKPDEEKKNPAPAPEQKENPSSQETRIDKGSDVKQGENQPKENRKSTQSVKTLFAPGGEVVKQDAGPSSPPELSSSNKGSSGATKNQSKREPEVASGNKSEPAKLPANDVLKQVDRTTSQVKTTIESVEKQVQSTIQNTPTPVSPAINKIKVKINLPE